MEVKRARVVAEAPVADFREAVLAGDYAGIAKAFEAKPELRTHTGWSNKSVLWVAMGGDGDEDFALWLRGQMAYDAELAQTRWGIDANRALGKGWLRLAAQLHPSARRVTLSFSRAAGQAPCRTAWLELREGDSLRGALARDLAAGGGVRDCLGRGVFGRAGAEQLQRAARAARWVDAESRCTIDVDAPLTPQLGALRFICPG
jgi:hypothetical protein